MNGPETGHSPLLSVLVSSREGPAHGVMPGRFEADGIVPSKRIFVGSETPGMVAREPTALPVPITVTDTTWPLLVQVVEYPVVLQIVLVGVVLTGCAEVGPLLSPTQPARPAQTSPAATSAPSRLAIPLASRIRQSGDPPSCAGWPRSITASVPAVGCISLRSPGLGKDGPVDSPPDVWSQAARVLDSETATTFLGCMVLELTLAARTQYGPEGSMPPGSEYSLRCFNELVHRTGMQICRSVGVADAGYPTEAYLSKLRYEAEDGELLAELEYAMGRAVKSVGGI